MPKRRVHEETAFAAVAEAAIANEISTYFPDTGLYRRLTRGGPQHAGDYLHREFAPAEDTARRAAVEVGAAAASSRCASPPLKRRRTSIVERLERDLAEFTRGGAASSISGSWATATAGAPAEAAADFSVSCRSCASRVLACYPCGVLTGYVVLWAESVLEVECVAARSALQPERVPPTGEGPGARGQHGQLKQAGANGRRDGEHPRMGPRPLLQRLARSTGAAAVHKSAAPAPHPAPPQTLSVTLHSLHIVNDDAVRHARPASFALQSVLQPGWPTALECYPRQMVHFGLLVYAAWQASAPTWQGVLSGTCAASLAEREAAKGREGEKGAARASPKRARKTSATDGTAPAGVRASALAALLPHTAQDAVLVLGLGGNVLGKCLDALLPPAVPLHVVEVEPAVLQACCEHAQFPASAAVVQGPQGRRADAPPASPRSPLPPRAQSGHLKKKPATPTASSAHARHTCGLDAAAVKWATEVVQRRCSSAAVTVSAVRRADACADLVTGAADEKRHVSPVTSSASSSPRLARTCMKTAAAQRGPYVCFLQDAYAFLRGSDAASPSIATARGQRAARAEPGRPASPSRCAARSTSAPARASGAEATPATTAAASAAAVAQYSIIFLDCYDPDREHMMHEGTLVELCARRLRPGGVLLVNAHVLPTTETLQRDFLSHGFATVQALRVSGCTQTVVACVAAGQTTPSASGGKLAAQGPGPELTLAERRARFTVGRIQLLAAALNAELRDGNTGDARCAFQFDATWLRSSRRAVVPRRLGRAAPASVAADVDLVVWQHHF